jgi:hypothetical protein
VIEDPTYHVAMALNAEETEALNTQK